MTRRWSDNDHYFGPFTYARDSRGYRPLALVLSSGDGDDYPGCSLRLSAFGHTLIASLPPVIRPWRQWVDTSKYSWASHSGGYWDQHSNEYGFSASEGFLQVFLGPQTGDSATTKSWSKFLPWTQWRHVRFSLYDLKGEHFYSGLDGTAKAQFELQRAAEKQCPAATFSFLDYDKEQLTAETRITEREWRFGTGSFRWLSLFRAPKITRSLDINFSGETGERKGSWKGGTVGHGIEMLSGELHEGAFRRYCEKHAMTFIGTAPKTVIAA